MKKVEFSTGDKVVTIKDGELRSGEIRNFFPVNPPVFVVQYEDGTIAKVPYDNVAPAPKTETAAENAPVEKSEITITPDEFREIACRVIAENTKGRPLVGLAIVPLVGKIHKALFEEPAKNDNFFN